MRIGILGINHKLAPLCLREQIAKICFKRFEESYFIHPHFSFVLLSTCNRTEIYFHSTDLAQTHSYLLGLLREKIEQEFEHLIYSYFGVDCFAHLARVTTGLDSAVVGETEIQGQVKQAYEAASCQRSLCFELHFLFQKCLKIGKELRTQYRLTMPTLEEAVGQLLLKRGSLLFVGLSQINYKIFSWIYKHAPQQSITFCNRTAEKLAALQVNTLPWPLLQHRWIEFDTILFATKSPECLVDRVPRRMHQAKLLIDLSVPRNVHPKVGKHIQLLNIDQLAQTIASCTQRAEVEHIEKRVLQAAHNQVGIFMLKKQRSLDSVEKEWHREYFPCQL